MYLCLDVLPHCVNPVIDWAWASHSAVLNALWHQTSKSLKPSRNVSWMHSISGRVP